MRPATLECDDCGDGRADLHLFGQAGWFCGDCAAKRGLMRVWDLADPESGAPPWAQDLDVPDGHPVPGLTCTGFITVTLDRFGYPVEQFKGRPVVNFLRRLLHGRRRVTVACSYFIPHERE